jgi:hypothetical protein
VEVKEEKMQVEQPEELQKPSNGHHASADLNLDEI